MNEFYLDRVDLFKLTGTFFCCCCILLIYINWSEHGTWISMTIIIILIWFTQQYMNSRFFVSSFIFVEAMLVFRLYFMPIVKNHLSGHHSSYSSCWFFLCLFFTFHFQFFHVMAFKGGRKQKISMEPIWCRAFVRLIVFCFRIYTSSFAIILVQLTLWHCSCFLPYNFFSSLLHIALYSLADMHNIYIVRAKRAKIMFFFFQYGFLISLL